MVRLSAEWCGCQGVGHYGVVRDGAVVVQVTTRWCVVVQRGGCGVFWCLVMT